MGSRAVAYTTISLEERKRADGVRRGWGGAVGYLLATVLLYVGVALGTQSEPPPGGAVCLRVRREESSAVALVGLGSPVRLVEATLRFDDVLVDANETDARWPPRLILGDDHFQASSTLREHTASSPPSRTLFEDTALVSTGQTQSLVSSGGRV
jgi:hypothetical protein